MLPSPPPSSFSLQIGKARTCVCKFKKKITIAKDTWPTEKGTLIKLLENILSMVKNPAPSGSDGRLGENC